MLGEIGLGVLSLFLEINSCGCWFLKVKSFFELYFSFEENQREIEVFRSDCSFFGRLPPRFVRDCSGFGVVFIQLPAVWIRRVQEAFVGFTMGCWAYEARGEHNQGPITSLSWDWRVCAAKDFNLSWFGLCVGDVRVRQIHLDDLFSWCYLWMCAC